jgi:hypothetical protein
MKDMRNIFLIALVVFPLIVAPIMIFIISYTFEPLYLCKGCSDDVYRRIATTCYGVREIFLKAGENITFQAYDDSFFNTSCMLKAGVSWLIWINITSDKPVKAVIGSNVFEGRNITYGCINMNNVTITASQDTKVVIEVRSITPCIFSTRYADLHRIFQALPNLYADRKCP